MDPRTVEAIVLQRRDLGENDRIVTLLTREEGKLEAVAKGARKAGAKAAAASEPITKVRVQLARGRRMAITTQWEVLDTFRPLRMGLGLLTRALYLCDLTAELTVEHEPCAEVYYLLSEALSGLCNVSCYPTTRLDRIVYGFELRLLRERGYEITTGVCAQCGTGVEPSSRDARMSFSASAGGVLCSRCRYKLRDSFSITKETIESLEGLARIPFESAEVLPMSANTERSVRKCLRWSIRYRCEKDLRSAALLEATRAVETAGLPTQVQGSTCS